MNDRQDVLTKIENFLSQKIGLNPMSIGSSRIAIAIQERMTQRGISDWLSYWREFFFSLEEQNAVIEKIVVPETWFFRSCEAYQFLKDYVTRASWRKEANKVLRVLSVPCSTGEEPYSIALTFLNAGVFAQNFVIDAVDINQKSLEKAKRGIYDSHSFRGRGFFDYQHYFQQCPEGYQLPNFIKNYVNFQWGNLVDPGFFVGKQPYDIIFCRNLLIYLEKPARTRVIQTLERLLTPTGLLFVGYAETGYLIESSFTAIRDPLVFAYLKTQPIKKTSLRNLSPPQPPKNQQKTPEKPIFPQSISPHSPSQKRPISQQSATSKVDSFLDKARTLANQGQLIEAANLCETYLRNHITSAEGYLLLGEVHQARGNDQVAEGCFEKAIYLEPNHYEALVHLALLKEQRGDLMGAKTIRERIQRLTNQ